MTSPQPVDLELEALRPRKGRTRASKACLSCRRRKVRCNVSVAGSPCSNCQLDCETCVVPERIHKGWSKRSRLASAAVALVRKPENHPDLTANSHGSQRAIDGSAQVGGGLSADPVSRRASPSPGSAHLNAQSSWKKETSATWDHRRQNERKFTTTVPISAYPFLTANGLDKLPPEDINYLDVKNCLRVPSRVYLDEFLQQYFRYVHPFFPLIQEAAFWDMYHGLNSRPNGSKTRFSLLVLQSMIFSACSFVDPSTLEELGFTSVRVARRVMYERARTLYNFDTERSPLHTAQAALLLAYWTPPFEDAATRPNTRWLRIAIENARSVRAHLWHTVPPATDPRMKDHQAALKRLWGCCIIRDGTLAISSRRCCQIRDLDPRSNTRFPLTLQDLEDDMHDSKVYDPLTNRQLSMAFLGLAEICVQMVAVSMLLFPFDAHHLTEAQPGGKAEETTRIMACKTSMDQWHQQSVKNVANCLDGKDSAAEQRPKVHPSVTLFTNLQKIYYHAARISVTNRHMLSFYGSEIARTRGAPALQLHGEVQEDTTAIGKCLRTLAEMRLVRFLPVTVVPCIALPLALNTARTRSKQISPNPKALIFKEAMNTCASIYEGVDSLEKAIRVMLNQEHLVRLMESEVPPMALKSADQEDVRAFPPTYYMRLALTMDLSICTGNLPTERDFPTTLQDPSSSEASDSPETIASETERIEPADVDSHPPPTEATSDALVLPDAEFEDPSTATQTFQDLVDFEGCTVLGDLMLLDEAVPPEDEMGAAVEAWDAGEPVPEPSDYYEALENFIFGTPGQGDGENEAW